MRDGAVLWMLAIVGANLFFAQSVLSVGTNGEAEPLRVAAYTDGTRRRENDTLINPKASAQTNRKVDEDDVLENAPADDSDEGMDLPNQQTSGIGKSWTDIESGSDAASGNKAKLEGQNARGLQSNSSRAHIEVGHSATGITSLALRSKTPKDGYVVEKEEEKLRNATVKLVLWLRNRLRKRLEDVARMEEATETEKVLLRNLNQTILNTTAARSVEIRLKLETQKKLSDFRRKSEQPEHQLLSVQNRAKKLSDQLAILGETYNVLAMKHRKLRDKLRSSGFSHWLDARGKEYMPATAVGVLSKSTELFSPLAEGVERAVQLDKELAEEVEGLVLQLPQRSLLGKVLEDLVMLLPLLPMLLLVCKLLQTFNRLSVLHLAMYVATAFMTEAALLLLGSACLGREALRALQMAHGRLLLGGVFLNATMYVGYMMTQLLITMLRFSRVELAQSLLGVAVGSQYYNTLFRPCVTDTPVTITVLSHLMMAVNFGLVTYEKKRVLNVHVAWEEKINGVLVGLETWICETADAIAGMFRDYGGDIDLCSDGVNGGTEHSDSRASTDGRGSITARRSRSACGGSQTRRKGQEDLPKRASIPHRLRTSLVAHPPATPRPTYGRWAGARIITSARQFSSRESPEQRRMQQSESECSVAYDSCRE